MDENDERFDLDVSCCMEISGIESILKVDAPKAKDMINGDTSANDYYNDSSSNCI